MTWPKVRSFDPHSPASFNSFFVLQLHIIENRYRLERQIFLGRQAVRRAMRTRAQERMEQKLESIPQAPLPPPITGTQAPVPGLSQSTSQDSPLAIDSDTEADFRHGNSRPHSKRHSRRGTGSHVSGFSRTQGISAQELRRAFANRRPWITSPVTDGDSGDDIPQVDYGRATPDPPPGGEDVGPPDLLSAPSPMLQNTSVPASPSALFKRLRTSSFFRRGSRIFGASGDNNAEQDGVAASSESSSDDDDLSILSRRTVHRVSRDSFSDEDDEYDGAVSQDH